jgi:hypothetical protein
MFWAEEENQPPQVKQIIALVREKYPEIRWTRLWVRNPKVNDDGIWFFWLADEDGEVQIESSYGVCPFLVETDKHDERFTAETIEQTADKIVEWLAMPGGHNVYFSHPR